MQQSTVFQSNRSQAVRLPKAVALPAAVKKVNVIALGSSRIITPADTSWDDWFDQAPCSADFLADREQPANQEREPL